MGWWDEKLGTTPAPRVDTPVPVRQYVPNPNAPTAFPQQPQAPVQVTKDNFLEAAESYKGGEGVRNSGRCPSCGSGNYFAQNMSIVSQQGMAAAPPRCYDCNYVPGRTSQGLPPS